MKLKNLSLLIFVISFLTVSCSSDDDNSTSVNLQDLEVTIDENPTNGDIVGTVQSNSTSPLTFSIVSQTPVGALEINATSGELTVLDAGLFDFETNPTITAIISSSEAVNTATVTINLNNINEIGDYNHGGVVFWIDPTDNTKGLVVSINDQSTTAEWGCDGTSIPGSSGAAIGDGAANTAAIEAACTTSGIAADIAANLTLNGYSDWFLPNLAELNEVYANKGIIDATALANGGSSFSNFYWTSNESTDPAHSATRAIFVYFNQFGSSNGNNATAPKDLSGGGPVRAVRAFQ